MSESIRHLPVLALRAVKLLVFLIPAVYIVVRMYTFTDTRTPLAHYYVAPVMGSVTSVLMGVAGVAWCARRTQPSGRERQPAGPANCPGAATTGVLVGQTFLSASDRRVRMYSSAEPIRTVAAG